MSCTGYGSVLLIYCDEISYFIYMVSCSYLFMAFLRPSGYVVSLDAQNRCETVSGEGSDSQQQSLIVFFVEVRIMVMRIGGSLRPNHQGATGCQQSCGRMKYVGDKKRVHIVFSR